MLDIKDIQDLSENNDRQQTLPERLHLRSSQRRQYRRKSIRSKGSRKRVSIRYRRPQRDSRRRQIHRSRRYSDYSARPGTVSPNADEGKNNSHHRHQRQNDYQRTHSSSIIAKIRYSVYREKLQQPYRSASDSTTAQRKPPLRGGRNGCKPQRRDSPAM